MRTAPPKSGAARRRLTRSFALPGQDEMALRLGASAWMSADLSDLACRLGRWWLIEFLALFPASMAASLVGHREIRLVLSADQDGVELRLAADGQRQLAVSRIGLADFTPTAIDDFL